MNDTPEIYDEARAELILRLALSEHRCADLLNILSDGGAATYDPIARRLALATAAQLETMMPTTTDRSKP